MKLSKIKGDARIELSKDEVLHLRSIIDDWLIEVATEEDEPGEKLDLAEVVRDWIDEEFE